MSQATPVVRLAVGVGPEKAFHLGLKAYPEKPMPVEIQKLEEEKREGKHSSIVIQKPAVETRPALLVSYVYLEPFLKYRHRYAFRDWVMDSGAFSAHNSGVEINLQDYIDCCKALLTSDPQLTEVFALDVIGDWKASLKNAEEMWKQGVPAIPCYHDGEPWSALKEMADNYPKIAIGGVAMTRGSRKIEFAKQVFARVWPKRIHGFGFGSKNQLMAVPWDSVDACNWEVGPCQFGSWQYFGGMSVRGSKQNLRVEVESYLKWEREARWKWRHESNTLAKLPAMAPSFAGKMESIDEEVNRLRLKPDKTKDDMSRLAKLLSTSTKNVKAKSSEELAKLLKKEGSRQMNNETPTVRLACCMSDGAGGCWGVDQMDRALGKHHYGETFEPTRDDISIKRTGPTKV